MEHLIEIEHLSFGYGERAILEDVSLVIAPHDFTLLIGPNGGGKTTLLKLILGILKPWRGTIRYQGETGQRLGYVPQTSRFNRSFPISVQDMVLTGCIQGGRPLLRHSREDREKTARILERLALGDQRHDSINDLSGGQLQRVLIARALVSDPLCLFLDEPTTSLDIASQTDLLDLLAELGERMSILVVTHDPTPYVQSYRHIACLNRRLHFHGRGELDAATLEGVYGCPVEILGHGIPHTLLADHGEDDPK